MKITITQDGDKDNAMNAEVNDLSAVPECVFAVAQYKGGGEFIATDRETGERLFRLSQEWLED